MADLFDILSMGARATADAATQDWDSLKSGRLPQQAMRAAGDIMSAYQNPAMGTYFPKVPSYYSYGQAVADEAKQYGAKAGESLAKDYANIGISTKLSDVIPNGGTREPLSVALEMLNPVRGAQANKAMEGWQFIRNQAGKLPQDMGRGPVGVPNELERILSGPAMGIKEMKPGPATVETYLQQLAKNQEYFPARNKLIPAIRHPGTGEIFEGAVGGSHPSDIVSQILTQRKQSVPGTLQFGYRPAYEGSPFVPESIANYLYTNKSNTEPIANLLKRGIPLDTITKIINEHGGKPLTQR